MFNSFYNPTFFVFLQILSCSLFHLCAKLMLITITSLVMDKVLEFIIRLTKRQAQSKLRVLCLLSMGLLFWMYINIGLFIGNYILNLYNSKCIQTICTQKWDLKYTSTNRGLFNRFVHRNQLLACLRWKIIA